MHVRSMDDGSPRESWSHRVSSADETLVSEIMNLSAITATPEMTTEELATVLLNGGLQSAPVIGEGGRPVGFVTAADLLRADRAARRTKKRAMTVGDVMVPVVHWLSEGASVAQAAALMAFERVQHLPIVNAGGRLVGVLSYAEVLAWLARGSGYLIPV